MKVNVYDQENVQKGRLILLNIAEDLKEYSKVKVQPGGTKKKQDKPEDKQKKPTSPEEVQKMADAQFVRLSEEEGMDLEDDSGNFDLQSKSYIYMELESTTNFKDIDIDKMLEHTSMEDFMRGLYVTGIEKSKQVKTSSAEDSTKKVMSALMTGQGLDELTSEID